SFSIQAQKSLRRRLMHLARFPRARPFPAPTPLERPDNLTRAPGGPEIRIKRDEYTVVATGGLTREAVVANCDYVGAGYGIPTENLPGECGITPGLGQVFPDDRIPNARPSCLIRRFADQAF